MDFFERDRAYRPEYYLKISKCEMHVRETTQNHVW
ncbi:unnamed protein product [Larinioides sclopetarius]|uniref:Uncharacterized protein n=1 Tax=Larinioides sclopetarius TaxID=280406 RepID=A0AAV2B7K7_9ARAC